MILLILMIILALVLGRAVFASNDGGPIRSAHKVKAGEKSFCFFVASNVTLTQSELSGMDDETLVKEILKRTGLFIKEASCNDPQHPLISVDEWTASGNTLGLSEEDIAAIRAADPAEGKSAKFHMDIQFTLKPEEKETPADDPAEDKDKEPAEDQSEDPADDPGKDPAADISGDTAEDQGEAPATDPGDALAEDPEATPSDDPAPDTGDEPLPDPGEDPAPDPGDEPLPDPGEDPAPEPGDDPAPDPGDDPEQPEEREIYTTYKLTSPELLFVVIVADEDAGAAEDECEPVEPALPEEPEVPEMPEIVIPDISEPTEILPEYRKIDMVDKSGAPLTPLLEEGEPVELTWIEPKNTIDPEKAKNWIESFPGGEIGFGGLMAAITAACIAAFIVNRRKDDDY